MIMVVAQCQSAVVWLLRNSTRIAVHARCVPLEFRGDLHVHAGSVAAVRPDCLQSRTPVAGDSPGDGLDQRFGLIGGCRALSRRGAFFSVNHGRRRDLAASACGLLALGRTVVAHRFSSLRPLHCPQESVGRALPPHRGWATTWRGFDMSYPEYYRARAEEAERKARETNLPNVRAQYLKAAATWADMASRSERAQQYRRDARPSVPA